MFCLRATFYSKYLDKQKEYERVRLCQAEVSQQGQLEGTNLFSESVICLEIIAFA